MTKYICMIILLSIAGPGAASVQKTIVVGPTLVECTGVSLQRCYRIKEDPEGAYSLYYDRIEGFEHQHGYEYRLLVEVITVDNPPADASSIRYRLVRELGREAVQFIRISAPGGSETIDPAKPVTVKGTGRGLFEGNVVIRFEDLDGNPLVQVPTTMQQQELGAPGVWQKSITLPFPVPQTIRLIAFSPSPQEGDAAITSTPVMLTTSAQARSGPENTPRRLAQSGQISEEDQAALDLGRKVLAVKEALRNPGTPNALQAVTDVGLDQRYYTMVRGWLAWQLQGDTSILDASRDGAPAGIRERVEFLKTAIRAIDLE